jgi:hypothetical protein
MGKFTLRVELVGATPKDYDVLHEHMQLQGFSRQIESGDGELYELPNAEYDFSGEFNRKEVLDKAKAAADAIGIRYRVLVTESKGRVWYGLRRTE